MASGMGWLGVVLDCPDPAALGEFYSKLTGWPIVHADADWVTLANTKDAQPKLSFQRAPDHRPPTWPDPASSMQIHIDFGVDNLDTAEAAAIALGAKKFDVQPEPESFRVLADPTGHVFCLCV
jgi:predicted enzyme related to lactoylglutathione lyase